MESNIRQYRKVTIQYFKISIMSTLEYPVNILGWLLSNPIQFIIGFAIIQFVVSEFGAINGWQYEQLAFLYGIAVISHAFSMMFFFQAWILGENIVYGEFDKFLIRPMSVLYQFLFCNFNLIGITDLIPGLCVFIYGSVKVGFQWSFMNICCLLSTIIGATLIRGGIYLMLGTLSFWLKGVEDFGSLTQELFDKTTMYPLSMYPKALQFLFTFIIPIGWVSYYPAGALLDIDTGFNLPFQLSWMTLIVGIIVIIIACKFFNYGLKHYESAGH